MQEILVYIALSLSIFYFGYLGYKKIFGKKEKDCGGDCGC